MEKIGIIKEIDKLGRIVIPKELRERFGFGERVEVIATKSGIILKSPEYKLVKIDNSVNKPKERETKDAPFQAK